jgi:hypothetical protein
MNELANRMIRAARLDPQLYEEVEHDPTMTFQAALVVVLASVAGGIGTIQWQGNPFGMLVMGSVASLGGWVIWSVLSWAIGTKLFPEATTEADIGQLLRTLGFATAPGVLRIFGVLPGFLGQFVLFAVTVWVLAAFIVAVRQALDYTSTWRAAGVCAVGFIVQVVFLSLVIHVFGVPATVA